MSPFVPTLHWQKRVVWPCGRDTSAIRRYLSRERASCSVTGWRDGLGQELYDGRAVACLGRCSLTPVASTDSE